MRKLIITPSYLYLIIAAAFSGVANDCYSQKTGNFVADDTVSTALPDVEVKSSSSERALTSSTPYQKIDSEKIRVAGITDISDALRRMSGVNIRDYGGAGGMKTVSIRGLGSQHTAVVYDGVSLSDCQSGQIDLSRYSLDNLRAISLYSGDNDDIFMPARAAASASSLYISSFDGNGASDFQPHLKAQMRFGSFGLYNPFVRFSKGFGKGFFFSGNAEFIHAKNNYPFTLVNGDYVTREKRENSKMNSWHAELNGSWKIEAGKTLSGKLYYYDNARYLPGPVIYYVNKSNEHLREKNFFGQLQFKGKMSSVLSLLALGKFNWATSRYTDFGGEYPNGKLDNYYIQREAYASGCLLYTPLPDISLDYSADWALANLSSNTKTAIRPYRHSILQTLSAKINVWRMTVMARALYSIYLNDAKDGVAGKDEQKFSPMVSMSLRPIEDVSLFVRTSYKNIFRLPTFSEAYYDNYGSVNLNPETTDLFNLGFTYQAPSLAVVSDFTASVDGYFNKVKNKIVAVPFNMFLWTVNNLGKVNVYGLDATLSATFNIERRNSILLDCSYSYQRAQVRTSPDDRDWMKQVAYTPLNSGSASISWLNPWVYVTAHATGCSSRYTTNYNHPETRIPGYMDFGLAISKKISFGAYSMSARLDILNILDKQYEIIARYPMPGRSWKLTVDFEI